MNPLILTATAFLTTVLCMAADPYEAALGRLQRLESPARLSSELKARVVASLPKDGEVRDLTPAEREKLAALAPVLKAHERQDDYLLKVVDSPQARLAIYARSVVLITRLALRMLSAQQLQALVAHEIGHEYVWEEFEAARKRGDYSQMRELELVCDGVAILTLQRIGAPVSSLIDGLRLIIGSDRANGLVTDDRSHPTVAERARFARRVTL